MSNEIGMMLKICHVSFEIVEMPRGLNWLVKNVRYL